MKFTELTVKEYDNFVQNPALESHYFQVKENIATKEVDGFQVVLLDFYLRELDTYLQKQNCLYVKMDPYWIYQIYDKDVNPLPNHEKSDALVNLFKSHGYTHHGFTTEYDTSSQVRWMGVLNLDGQT